MYMVTNENDFTFTAKFNSQEFQFPAGEYVYCDDEAAKHIFALGQANKNEVLLRHGWVRPSEPAERGLAILAKFKFEHMLPNYENRLAQVGLNDHGKAPVVQNGAAGYGADAPAPAAPVEEAPVEVPVEVQSFKTPSDLRRGPGRPAAHATA